MVNALLPSYRLGVLASPGEYWHLLDEFGDRVDRHKVVMQRRISPLSDLRSLWNLYRIFRRKRPAMVHSMTPKAGLLCMIAARLARVPVRVHTFTGLVFPTSTGIMRKVLMFTDRITCACATHVVPEGRGVLNDLKNNGITRKPMQVLANGNCRGIDMAHFSRTPDVEARAAQIRRPGTFTFIYIGRLVADKGVNELVKAFVNLHASAPHVRLLMVAYAEEGIDPVSAETSRVLATHPAITVTGFQPDVRPWLAAADCAVLPSYREGFPNVVLEAGAMGLPQIVTDINGSNEIIIEGKNGLIVPSHDAKSLQIAMNKLSKDEEMYNKMCTFARIMIEERYARPIVVNALTVFYQQILPL